MSKFNDFFKKVYQPLNEKKLSADEKKAMLDKAKGALSGIKLPDYMKDASTSVGQTGVKLKFKYNQGVFNVPMHVTVGVTDEGYHIYSGPDFSNTRYARDLVPNEVSKILVKDKNYDKDVQQKFEKVVTDNNIDGAQGEDSIKPSAEKLISTMKKALDSTYAGILSIVGNAKPKEDDKKDKDEDEEINDKDFDSSKDYEKED